MILIAQKLGTKGPLVDIDARPVWQAADGTRYHIAHGPADELGVSQPDPVETLPVAGKSVALIVVPSDGRSTLDAVGLSPAQVDGDDK
jgi:hypothetical protein